MSESPHTCHWCGQHDAGCFCHSAPRIVLTLTEGFVGAAKAVAALGISAIIAVLVLLAIAGCGGGLN